MSLAALPYPTMTVAEIAALPVRTLAVSDVAGNRPDKSVPRDGSLLFLWATNRFLESAHDVCRAWGFSPTLTLAWCKSEAYAGGTFTSNLEFIIVGRRGSPKPFREHVGTRWFRWPQAGHSVKPAAFFDLVESVCHGPFLEMFARRQRLGWDTWGNEALPHVELSV